MHITPQPACEAQLCSPCWAGPIPPANGQQGHFLCCLGFFFPKIFGNQGAALGKRHRRDRTARCLSNQPSSGRTGIITGCKPYPLAMHKTICLCNSPHPDRSRLILEKQPKPNCSIKNLPGRRNILQATSQRLAAASLHLVSRAGRRWVACRAHPHTWQHRREPLWRPMI